MFWTTEEIHISSKIDKLVDKMEELSLEEFEKRLHKLTSMCPHRKISLGRCVVCGCKARYCRK